MRARVALILAAVVTAATIGCHEPPPPLGSAPVVAPVLATAPDQVVDPEHWAFPRVCFNQWQGEHDVPVTRQGGEGRRVAVIGDSLTTQARKLLIARGGFDWHVTSFCGARVADYLPGGALHDTLADLRAFEPEAVVIALGTNDGRAGDSLVDSAPALLRELPDGVPVTWVLPAPSHDDTDYDTAVVRADVTNLTHVTVVDWAEFADMPDARGDDSIHLTWTGAGVYASLIAGGTRPLTTV